MEYFGYKSWDREHIAYFSSNIVTMFTVSTNRNPSVPFLIAMNFISQTL